MYVEMRPVLVVAHCGENLSWVDDQCALFLECLFTKSAQTELRFDEDATYHVRYFTGVAVLNLRQVVDHGRLCRLFQRATCGT